MGKFSNITGIYIFLHLFILMTLERVMKFKSELHRLSELIVIDDGTQFSSTLQHTVPKCYIGKEQQKRLWTCSF